jgi:hypothetical protein
MRTFILSILLVAVVAVGILVTLNPIRERFLNTPAPYSDVGTGDASTIKGWGDLTPTEAAYIKNNRLYRNQKFNRTDDVSGPLNSNDTTIIGMFRSGASIIQNNIAKGDFSVAGPNPGSITIEESTEFMRARNVQGIEGDVPMTAAEKQTISDKRRAFATPTPSPVAATPNPSPVAATPSSVPTTVSYPTLTAEPAASSLTLTPDETAAVLKMRKAAAVQQARALLASTQDSYSREHRNYERDDEYDYKSKRARRQYGNDYPDTECQNCCD